MDIFEFNYSYAAITWQITIRVDGDKDAHGKYSTYVDVIQCGSGCKKSDQSSGCKTWRVTDEQLVRHMGCAMYLAFYRVIKYNREAIKYYDFDEKVLKRCEEVCNGDTLDIEESIRKYKTNDYLTLWREVKSNLAAAIVIIGNFDWVHYQQESCKLTDHLRSMIEYIIYSLTFITKRDQSYSLFAQDILNNIQCHRSLYPTDVKIKICLGVEPVTSYQTTSGKECTIEEALSDDSSWWEYFWIAVILLIIIFLIMWFLTRAAERRGYKIRKTYGDPLTINILPPSSIN